MYSQSAKASNTESQDTGKDQKNSEISKTSKIPPPVVKGNDNVIILKHGFLEIDDEDYPWKIGGIKLGIKNISDVMIATAFFEVIFYSINGDIVDRTTHCETELKPGQSRGIVIFPTIKGYDRFGSYDIRLTQMTTAEEERIQFLRHQARTNELGEEEIIGIVKNISNIKANAKIVVTFFNKNKDSIGSRSITLKNIEPGSTKHYSLLFKAPEGEKVRSFSLNINDA